VGVGEGHVVGMYRWLSVVPLKFASLRPPIW
jgi:hypothetical protein